MDAEYMQTVRTPLRGIGFGSSCTLKNLRTSYLLASERLFLDNPTMDGTAKLDPSFVGRDRTDTSWSETMFLYCQYC